MDGRGGAITIETDRLLLRPWRPSDLEPYAAINADPVAMEFFPATASRAESDASAARHSAHIEEHGWGLWAVEVKGGPSFIGFTGLAVPGFDADFTPCVEVGWRLAAEHWGRGYAPEAAQAVLADGFGRLGLDEIVSFTAVINHRSRRVMDKIGMTHDGEFDHPTLPDHRLTRHVLYRISSSSGTRPGA